MSMRMILLLLLCALSLAARDPARAEESGSFVKVGVVTRSFTPPEPYDWRGAQTHALVTTIWYPTDASAEASPQWYGRRNAPIFSGGTVAKDAHLAMTPARFPLILLSHGTGGSSLALAWLGTELAAHGYVVAAVNHPGNNALEAYTVQGFSLWWERATDISALIDLLRADPVFGDRLDPRRIGAAGFSLGAYTMIELAGGVTELPLLYAFCDHAPDACQGPPEFPDLRAKRAALMKDDAGFRAALDRAGDSYRDARIRAVVAIAPPLGFVFSQESLERIATPVRIVVGAGDRLAPPPSSLRLAELIPNAELTVFPKAVSHYSFLPVCNEQGRKLLPLFCVDAPGADRDAIHARTADLALAFFAATLK